MNVTFSCSSDEEKLLPSLLRLAEVGDRISTSPTGSYSTTSNVDAAGDALRRSIIGSDDDTDEDEEAESDEGEIEDGEKAKEGSKKGKEKEGSEKGKEKEEGPTKKKLKVKKEGPSRPSDTGRKFGKLEASSTPKRKSTGVEAALEQRSAEKTKQDAQLNEAKVKAEKMGTLMALARELREADYTLSFSDAMEQAKVMYAEI
ncbi:unnamed protein product [Tilletia caries]|nr:hypothetical protein CF335_g8385 [Tilletia laevis]KAE8191748.1 hypothetical protein CF336_g4740 [Tilletia laevis]CAD6915718.1 unnamed protein product [Tilletia caries]